MGYYTLCWALGSAAYSACFAITAGRYYTAAIFGIISAGWLAVFVHALIVMRRDKALPFYVGNV
ncbi:MAG: hypothetical protein FWC27_03005, partial [Firmicutes bacterium]|nr:hypothetical protein [Bacillota bacterium]